MRLVRPRPAKPKLRLRKGNQKRPAGIAEVEQDRGCNSLALGKLKDKVEGSPRVSVSKVEVSWKVEIPGYRLEEFQIIRVWFSGLEFEMLGSVELRIVGVFHFP